MTIGLLALSAPRALARARPRHVLVVGGERVHRAVESASRHSGWAVTTFDVEAGLLPTEPWDELVVDAEQMDRLRDGHPDVIRRSARIWVLPAGEAGPRLRAGVFDDPLPIVGRAVKRTLDVVLALAGLLLALPVLALAVVAIRLDSPGPAVFKQVRMGANGRRFTLYKLRTMYHGNDDSAHRAYVARLIAGMGERCDNLFKLAHDPRVTRVGRRARQFSVDELPQLWNVLKGDMSLVGPRPPLPHEAELYSAPAWGRLRVKPGITGLWQVSGRSQVSFEDMVALDVRYWQRWSLRSDLGILLRTPAVVLSGRGAA